MKSPTDKLDGTAIVDVSCFNQSVMICEMSVDSGSVVLRIYLEVAPYNK